MSDRHQETALLSALRGSQEGMVSPPWPCCILPGHILYLLFLTSASRSLLGKQASPTVSPFVPRVYMFLKSAQLSTGWSDWFSDEGVILVGTVRVNPRNLIGPSGRKKALFLLGPLNEGFKLEGSLPENESSTK